MAFYRRAFLYLWRKRGKSLLLLLIFLFINTMILSTSLILRATEETKAAMQEKTKSKVVCEIAEVRRANHSTGFGTNSKPSLMLFL